MIKPIIVLSMHKKGYPMADYYCDPPEDYGDEWPVPDWYKTGMVNEPMDEFRARCEAIWPGVITCLADDE